MRDVHPHGRVAFLPYAPVTLKGLKPKESDFEANTLGKHLRKRRLELGLSQKAAANRLGISWRTVFNWEKGNSEPAMEAMPAIIRFLGYDPFPEPQTLRERMLSKRRIMGWSIREAGRQLGVDEGTWGQWERTGCILWKRYRSMVEDFLDAPDR